MQCSIEIAGQAFEITAIRLSGDPRDANEVKLESCMGRGGSVRWAVRRGSSCLSSQGSWTIEPQPSSRDDAFLALHRFETPEAAVVVWRTKSRCPAPHETDGGQC